MRVFNVFFNKEKLFQFGKSIPDEIKGTNLALIQIVLNEEQNVYYTLYGIAVIDYTIKTIDTERIVRPCRMKLVSMVIVRGRLAVPFVDLLG